MKRAWLLAAMSLIIAALTLTMLWSCSKSRRPVQDEPRNLRTVVAIAGEDMITIDDVFTELKSLHQLGGKIMATPDDALREAIHKSLVWQVAGEESWDFDPAQIHRLAHNRTHAPMMDYMFYDLFGSQIMVTDSQVDSAYQADILFYATPERRRVTHLLISTDSRAWAVAGIDVSDLGEEQIDRKAKALIEDLYQQVRNGADLGELASEHSHDSGSKEKQGNLGFFSPGEMVKDFEETVYRMKMGEVSRPFKTEFGYHIVRLDETAPEIVAPLEDLREQLRTNLKRRLEQQMSVRFVDSLMAEAEYRWNEDLLQKDVGDYEQRDWVCIVNDNDTVEAMILSNAELRARTARRYPEFTTEVRQQLVLDRITPHVLASAAIDLGYAASDTMQQVYNYFRCLEISNRVFTERKQLGDWEATEEEMKVYYEKHEEKYLSNKPVEVQHIVVEDSLAALRIKEELETGADFKATAMKYYPGEDDIKKVAYDLGWISAETMGQVFYDAAWLTRVGDITGPVKSDWGYHIIKVVDKKPRLTFLMAQRDIKEKLHEEKLMEVEANWVKRISRGKRIEIFDDIMSKVNFKNRKYYQMVTDSILQAQAAAQDSVS
ncbi:MAG: peptidylprolyl isomerase [candidate division Zixibacteria bacterium]|nr:peptidylprolyl isomerase [candidate division Zixibacteria bacterium]